MQRVGDRRLGTAATTTTAITNGGFAITIDGVVKQVASCDFSAQTNLNGVASILQTKLNALSSGTTCVWDAVYGRFIIRSGTTGASSTLTYGAAPASGTDISALLGLTAASGAGAPVGGVVAETALQCAQTLADFSTAWYSLQFASSAAINDANHILVAQFIEAASPNRIYGITTQNTAVLDPAQTNDLASVLKSLNLSRTYIQYSSSSPYACASFFGRASTVDFRGSNTTITMMFKQEPGVAAETLPASAFEAVRAGTPTGPPLTLLEARDATRTGLLVRRAVDERRTVELAEIVAGGRV